MTFYDVVLSNIAQPADLNQVVNFANTLNFPPAVTTNGSTSGTLTLYEPLQGIVKIAVLLFANFRNNGGSTQGIILPTPFSGRSKIWAGNLPSTGISLQLGGVSQTILLQTGLPTSGGAAGTTTSFTVIQGNSVGEVAAGWDTLIIPSGGSGVTNGMIVVIGL
jgi:hypothetical protein